MQKGDGTIRGGRRWRGQAKEETMNLEQQAMNDAMSNKNMMDDPNWTAEDRKKYQAAYTNAQKKTDNK